MTNIDKVIEAYIKRVQLGNYVPCELCGNLHDEGGLIVRNGKDLYVCLDCLEKEQEKE